MSQRVALRRGKAADWLVVDPILAPGEPGYESDTHLMKLGDGVSHWSNLDYTVMDSRLLISTSLVVVSATAPVAKTPGSIWFLSAAGSPIPVPPTPPSLLAYAGTVTLTGTGTLLLTAATTATGSLLLSSTGTLTASGH